MHFFVLCHTVCSVQYTCMYIVATVPTQCFTCPIDHSPQPTIVRNVRQARECLEIGESQEFFDEVRYLLGSIKPAAPLKSRCLG